MFSINETSKLIVSNHVSVKSAANLSGYSMQYIRRLLRLNRLVSKKFGQVWLVEIDSLSDYLEHALKSEDQRFSPK